MTNDVQIRHSSFVIRSLRVDQQRDRRRVAMDEVRAADGADLAVAKEAGGGEGAEVLAERVGVVMRDAKEAFAAAGAGEDERGEGLHAMARLLEEEALEVLVGGTA